MTDLAISSGGLGLAALRYAEAVAEAGGNTSLLVARRVCSPELTPKQNCKNLHIFRPLFKGSAIVRFFRQYYYIRQLCVKNDVQVVHLHGVWLSEFVAAAFAARSLKIPYVISPHGCFEPWALNFKRGKKSFAMAMYQRKLTERAAVLFATAEQEYESLRTLGFRNAIAIIPNGVELPPVVTSSKLNKENRNILFLSRIHPVKGLLNLVEAWSRKRAENWKITVAGPDECGHLAEVKAAVEKYGLTRDINFVGPVHGAAKAKCFADADVFVLPTFSENFGIAVAEALANRVPVITTTGAPWSELESNGCGWWVPPTVDGIASALEQAIQTKPEELSRMGARGRVLVEKKYSWVKIGIDGLAIYRWIIDKELTQPSCVRL